MSKDIALILNGWDYNSNEVTVRKVSGVDGREKIQMRLDLGVLQMESEGRPDGQRPFGHETLLDHFQEKLSRYRERHGGEEGFFLDSDECSDLKQEAMQFYHRYLSLFHLGDYVEVLRDTGHNLRLFDFLRTHAEEDGDRVSLEQFRPYVLMMNTRAYACLSIEERDFDRALEQIDEGIDRIEDFLREMDREEMIDHCREIAFLEEWSDRIRSNKPLSREEKLRRELQNAVDAENYERAAQIRDEIKQAAV